MKSTRRMVYFNGKFVPEHEAKISIYDSALMFGDMVFEMTRSFQKKQFKLMEHIERLYLGLKILRIPISISPKEMEEACYRVIEVNDHLFEDDDEHRLMIDVSRGLLGIYESIEGLEKGTNVIIADFPLEGDHFKAFLSGSGEINLNLDVTAVNGTVTGSGEITLTVKASKVNFNVTGSGDIEADGIKADTAEARVTGSGDIICKGNPRKQKTKVTGSGDIIVQN